MFQMLFDQIDKTVLPLYNSNGKTKLCTEPKLISIYYKNYKVPFDPKMSIEPQ